MFISDITTKTQQVAGLQNMSEIKQTRRLQIVGGSTYTVSLPKTWIDELQLKKNCDITLVKKS